MYYIRCEMTTLYLKFFNRDHLAILCLPLYIYYPLSFIFKIVLLSQKSRKQLRHTTPNANDKIVMISTWPSQKWVLILTSWVRARATRIEELWMQCRLKELWPSGDQGRAFVLALTLQFYQGVRLGNGPLCGIKGGSFLACAEQEKQQNHRALTLKSGPGLQFYCGSL